MLDVHLPHGKLHGLRDFLLHLFTITVGLLIAVQIESCVEWRHHVHLAQEARESLRTEIEQNLKDLQAAQTGLQAWRKAVDDDLAVVARIQLHPNDPAAQKASIQISASGIRLRDTAWRTAQATGALAYMPYEEAQRYASIYQAQAALTELQDKPADDVAAILGLISKFKWGDNGRITADQAGAFAERLGQMRVHLAAGAVAIHACIESDSAFLENREPRRDFTESLK